MAATEEPTEPTSSGVGVRSYDAALCLIPPRQLWPSIDRLRMLYDKAYEKWPPHVNLLYPFVVPDNLSLASELILSKLRDWSQEQGNSRLRVRLDEAGEFFHKHSNTIYICDKDPTHVSRLAELRRLILSALGQNEGDDQMHMTIGQSEDKNSSPHKFLLDKARLLPAVVWDINELHIFVRERTQVVGNTTSQMRLWGTIDLRSLSLTQEKEPIALLGSDGLSQMLGTGSGSTRESESSIRLPYVFSPSDQKWALYSTQPPVDEASLPQGLSIASYNVLAEFHHPPSHDRYPIIIRNLLEQLAAAEVLVLEEVTDDFLSYLLRDENIRQAYRFVSHGPPEQLDIEPLPSHINTIILSKLFFSWNWISFRQHHKGSIIAKFENIGKECENGRLPAILSTAHLTCGFTDGSVAKKKLELQSLLKYLSDSYPENPWIVVGDFNITTSAYTIDAALKKKAISPQTATYLTDLETSLTEAGLVDAWSYARVQFGDSSFDQDERHTSEVFEGEEGATFDPTTNELSAEIVGNGFNNRPQRYDRILIKGQDFFNISGFNMFGKNKGPLGHETAGEGSDATEVPLSYGSDHWGVRCSLKITSGTSERHMDDSSKLSVPVTLNMAPGPLGDVSELRERLAKRNVFPSEEDITARQAALSLLKEIIIEEADSVNSRGKPVFVLVPVGSYGLGVWTPSSDIDCLCIGPVSPRVFFALATQRLRNASARGVKILRRVRAHSGTMIELEVLGIKMDLQYCPATFIAETWPYAMSLPPTDPAFTLSVQTLAKLKPVRDLYYLRRTVPDFVAFKLAHQAIKFWAKQRGIYAAKFGYLGGIHISILLSRVSKLISYDGKTVSVPTVLTTFFDHYANFDWKNHMAFDPFFHKRPRYVRTAREPMVILGYHAPALNTAIAASPPSVRTMSDEFKRANALLSRDGMTWADFLGDETSEPGATEFLRCYKTYIKIDAQFWGVSLAKGSSFVGWLESRCVMLLVGESAAFSYNPSLICANKKQISTEDCQTCTQGSGQHASLVKRPLKVIRITKVTTWLASTGWMVPPARR